MSSSHAAPVSNAARWYRDRWPWLLMLGPAIVAVAGACTVWLAVASDDGLVSDDYYKRGLAVNRTIERVSRAEALGVAATVDVSANGVAQVALESIAEDDDAHPRMLRLVLSHPTRAGYDAHATLARIAPGRYAGTMPSLLPGRWRVSVETDAWRLSARDVDGPIEGVRLGRASD